jgi:hypothetical protein
MPQDSYLLYALIIACEVGFWVVLLLSLVLRYLYRQERSSRVLLLGLPLIDILLLLFTGVDLRRGAEATFAYGLAAAYIGFSIAFGAQAVAWADGRFSYHFAAGPAPPKSPERDWPAIRYELSLWVRCIVACLITMALVETLIQVAATGEEAIQPLAAWHQHAFGCIVLWFLFGPVWTVAASWRPAR